MSTRTKAAAGIVLLLALAAVWFLLPAREWIRYGGEGGAAKALQCPDEVEPGLL